MRDIQLIFSNRMVDESHFLLAKKDISSCSIFGRLLRISDTDQRMSCTTCRNRPGDGELAQTNLISVCDRPECLQKRRNLLPVIKAEPFVITSQVSSGKLTIQSEFSRQQPLS